MLAGTIIANEDLEILRPCPKDAFPPYKKYEIIGKKLKRELPKGDYFTKEDLD